VDTFGVLLAGALAVRDCPVTKVRGMLDRAVPELMDQIQEAREASQEADLILETLLSLHIEVQRHETDDRDNNRINREKMTIGRALLVAQGRPTSDEAQALADVGITVTVNGKQQYLAIALRHAALTKLFQGTRWKRDGAWTGGLRNLDGVIRNYPVSLDGRPKKCTLVPLPARDVEADTPSSPGSVVHAFPSPKTGFGGSNKKRSNRFADLDDLVADVDDHADVPF
jgi:hypothetical protein